MRLPLRNTLLAALAVVVLVTRAGVPIAQEQSSSHVVVVNNPLLYFAKRIGGSELDVRLPAPEGGDPAQWKPSVDELLAMQGAELIFLNGAGYSSWLDKVSLADSRLVVTSEAAREQWIEQEGQVTHSHGPEGEHAHSGYQFTTWMDMRLARVQAEAVAAALWERWPGKEAEYDRNLEQLLADIDGLDAGYEAELARLADRQFIYSHPVYQYFERRYDAAGTSLHWEPDAMPSDEQWRELVELAGEGALFVWEGEPDAAIAARMAAMGIESVVIDPAENVAEQDWLSVQRANIARLRSIK